MRFHFICLLILFSRAAQGQQTREEDSLLRHHWTTREEAKGPYMSLTYNGIVPYLAKDGYYVRTAVIGRSAQVQHVYRLQLELYSDCPLLYRMAQAHAFDWDEETIIIREYNKWRIAGRPVNDTTPALWGILDADSHYHNFPTFMASCISFSAFLIPGMFYGHYSNGRFPKVPHLHPDRPELESDPDYRIAYRLRAHEKKFKANWLGLPMALLVAIVVGVIVNYHL